MNILGIDFGLQKTGIALGNSVSKFSEPYSVIREPNMEKLIEKIKILINKEDIEKIVIGESENTSARLSRIFGEKLGNECTIEIVFQDETLSSKDAQSMAIESQQSRKKRRSMIDAYAASIILNNYFSNNNF